MDFMVARITMFPACWLMGRQWREEVMKTQYTVALAMLTGVGIGAVAVQGLHAQAKPPIYYIAEIDVTDIDAYTKEYAPRAQALIKSMGGRVLAAGQKVTALQGARIQ
jgi:Domain of unknown function (DUF1330)